MNYQTGDSSYNYAPSRAGWFEIADPMALGTNIAVMSDGSPVTSAPSGGGIRHALK